MYICINKKQNNMTEQTMKNVIIYIWANDNITIDNKMNLTSLIHQIYFK